MHCAIALSTAVLDRVTKTMSVAPLLTARQPSVAIYSLDMEAEEPAQELRERPGGSGLPAPDKPYGFCRRKPP